MSKQLALSAALSVLAMASVAVLAAPATQNAQGSGISLLKAAAPGNAVPSLGTLLPGLR